MVAVRSLTSCSGLRESKPGPPSGSPASMPMRMAIWLIPLALYPLMACSKRGRGGELLGESARIGLQAPS